MATESSQAGAEMRTLIEKWGRLHAVRTAFGFIAVITFLMACVSH
jgi:hypothetical protein